jgi:hypothetical protein
MAVASRDERFWRSCETPLELFRQFELLNDSRRARFWLVGCCRLICEQHSAGGEAVLVIAERFADGYVTEGELVHARDAVAEELAAVDAELRRLDDELFSQCVEIDLGRASPDSTGRIVTQLAGMQQRREAANLVAETTRVNIQDAGWFGYYLNPERFKLADLIRCVFPNPFRSVTLDPVWRTDTVLAIARQIYDSRDFSAMPILADALQDADCNNDDILDHCRRLPPHCRGCWVLDLVLGK